MAEFTNRSEIPTTSCWPIQVLYSDLEIGGVRLWGWWVMWGGTWRCSNKPWILLLIGSIYMVSPLEINVIVDRINSYNIWYHTGTPLRRKVLCLWHQRRGAQSSTQVLHIDQKSFLCCFLDAIASLESIIWHDWQHSTFFSKWPKIPKESTNRRSRVLFPRVSYKCWSCTHQTKQEIFSK